MASSFDTSLSALDRRAPRTPKGRLPTTATPEASFILTCLTPTAPSRALPAPPGSNISKNRRRRAHRCRGRQGDEVAQPKASSPAIHGGILESRRRSLPVADYFALTLARPRKGALMPARSVADQISVRKDLRRQRHQSRSDVATTFLLQTPGRTQGWRRVRSPGSKKAVQIPSNTLLVEEAETTVHADQSNQIW